MPAPLNYTIYPVGDTALTIDFGNKISEEINSHVLFLFRQLQQHPLNGIKELLPAYSSLTVYYDVVTIRRQSGNTTGYEWICNWLRPQLKKTSGEFEQPSRLVRIPVCYKGDFAPDLPAVIKEKQLSAEELIQLHTGVTYRVYMLGFLPGFPYMGETDARLAMPRKIKPGPVKTGSVGIAGRQTGIYSLSSPGGWQIIGRTPLQLFTVSADEPALLKAGDRIQFYSISTHEFNHY